jgi:hypothetical protein
MANVTTVSTDECVKSSVVAQVMNDERGRKRSWPIPIYSDSTWRAEETQETSIAIVL